jgi:hypothetical protein
MVSRRLAASISPTRAGAQAVPQERSSDEPASHDDKANQADRPKRHALDVSRCNIKIGRHFAQKNREGMQSVGHGTAWQVTIPGVTEHCGRSLPLLWEPLRIVVMMARMRDYGQFVCWRKSA